MLRHQDDIALTLPRNVPGVPGNNPSNNKTVLPTPQTQRRMEGRTALDSLPLPNPKFLGDDTGGDLHREPAI